MRKFKSESELREIAELHSKYINIRTMDGGNSRNFTRKATKKQREILYGILYGALLGLNWGERMRSSMRQSSKRTFSCVLIFVTVRNCKGT